MNFSPRKPASGVAGLALSVLTASVGTSAANVALPALATAFDATTAQVRWVVVAYLLGMTATSVVVGSLGDRLGRRTVMLWGLTLFVGAAVIAAASPTLGVLVLARGAQGAGAAVMTTLALALARDESADDRTGRVMGLLGTTSAVGTALGPAAGGILIGVGGWSAPFWAMVPLGAAALLLSLLTPAQARPIRGRSRFDTIGAALLTTGIAAYALALTAPSGEWPVLPLLVGAAALTVVFVAVERRTAKPIVPLEALASSTVTVGMVSNFVVATVMMTTLVVGPFALHDGLGLSLGVVGLVMATGPVISAISGVFAGRLVDRVSAHGTRTAGLALMTVGASALGLLPPWWGTVGYVAALAVLTPGYQLFLAANNTRVLRNIDTSRRGTIAGLLGLSRNLGLITGASAMGGLYAALTAGAGGAPPAYLGAMRVTFLVAALLTALATALSRLTPHPAHRLENAHT